MPTITLSRRLGKTLWQGYSPDMTDDAIRAHFTEKWGYAPAEVLRQSSIVLAGPVGGSGRGQSGAQGVGRERNALQSPMALPSASGEVR